MTDNLPFWLWPRTVVAVSGLWGAGVAYLLMHHLKLLPMPQLVLASLAMYLVGFLVHIYGQDCVKYVRVAGNYVLGKWSFAGSRSTYENFTASRSAWCARWAFATLAIQTLVGGCFIFSALH